MVDPSTHKGRAPVGGGCLIAAFIVIGAIAGAALRQPSIGVLVGTAVGIGISVVLWLWDRKR